MGVARATRPNSWAERIHPVTDVQRMISPSGVPRSAILPNFSRRELGMASLPGAREQPAPNRRPSTGRPARGGHADTSTSDLPPTAAPRSRTIKRIERNVRAERARGNSASSMAGARRCTIASLVRLRTDTSGRYALMTWQECER